MSKDSMQMYFQLGDYKTQKERVLKHLKEHKTITTLEAIYELKVLRVSNVIMELRKEGYTISTDLVESKDVVNKYAKYTLIAEPTERKKVKVQRRKKSNELFKHAIR